MLREIYPKGRDGYRGHEAARSTGNPEFFREFFIEKFITVNAQGNLSEGPGGGKGYEDRFAVLNLTALRVVWETGSSIHREPRKNITVFHQEILLQKKVRNSNTPKGREGVRGNRGFPLS